MRAGDTKGLLMATILWLTARATYQLYQISAPPASSKVKQAIYTASNLFEHRLYGYSSMVFKTFDFKLGE